MGVLIYAAGEAAMQTLPLTELHVAIIMDGNGRWASTQGKPRTIGHRAGAHRVKEIVRYAGQIGLGTLTLWGFSTDNWKRPHHEINVLMRLFENFIIREADELDAMAVRVRFLGRRSGLPDQLQRVMQQLETRTAGNTGLQLQIALNYGGEQEIEDAMQALQASGLPLTGKNLQQVVYGDVPPPDLIVRTSGEYRTSGFQPLAFHAEWYFEPKLWPDFTPDDLDAALTHFANRDRRKGGLSEAKQA